MDASSRKPDADRVKIDCAVNGRMFMVTERQPAKLCWAPFDLNDWVILDGQIDNLIPDGNTLLIRLRDGSLYQLRGNTPGNFAMVLLKKPSAAGPDDDAFWEVSPRYDTRAEIVGMSLDGRPAPQLERATIKKRKVDNRPAHGQKRAYFDD